MRARFVRICELIEAVGLDRVGMPYVKHLTGPLWEMRLVGRDGIARGLYVAVREKRIVVVRVFIEKTTQSVVARLEGGRVHLSTRTLGRIAQATGTRLKISFEGG